MMVIYLKRGKVEEDIQQEDLKVSEIVRNTINKIEKEGDQALKELSEKFDKWSPETFRLSEQQIEEICASIPEQTILDNKLIETMKDPDGDLTSYTRGDATTSTGDSAPATGSYVYVNNGTVEAVKLVSNKKNRGVQSTTNGAVDVEDLKREEVRNTTAESE